MDSQIPKISVIIKVSMMSKSLKLTLTALKKQTVSRDIELILLSCGPEANVLQKETVGEFYMTKVVLIDERLHEGAYKKVGVMRATAPLIMFMEDHSYPEATCLESIIHIHGENDYAAVGPLILNANPTTGTSWGCYLVFYGQWGYKRPAECNEHLPANQSCYARKILLANEEGLADKLKVESVFHWQLISQGHRLKLADSARLYHLNTSRLSRLLVEYFLNSRIFAASRFQKKEMMKRLIYTVGSPLIPFLRLSRIHKIYKSAHIPVKDFIRSLPALWLCLCAGAFGEAIGYSLGSKGAEPWLHRILSNPDNLVKQSDLDEVECLLS